MQQAVMRCTGRQLLRRHLPPALEEGVAKSGGPAPNGLLERVRDEQERGLIERALLQAGDCRSRAATALGISRGTLYNKMRKYGISKVTVSHHGPLGHGPHRFHSSQ
jgi:DNA-binding NtrC family response regulator